MVIAYKASGVNSSVTLLQAHKWNVGICRFDVKGKAQVQTHKAENTDAKHRDGATRNSDEEAVMALERRGCITKGAIASQPFCGRSK